MSEWVESTSSTNDGKTLSETAPDNPSRGDEWIDTSFRKPARKIYYDEKWVSLIEGSNVPTKQTYTSGTHEVDVSDITKTVTVSVAGQEGQPGAVGGYAIAEIDLSSYDTLTVYPGSYREGGDGEGYTPGGGSYEYDEAGDGGNSSGIEADGDLILAAGGGGGVTEEVEGWTDYYSGGGGGGPAGGDGGYGDNGPTAGGVYKDDSADVIIQNTDTASEPEVQLFIKSD
jgi:hypothetical protein